MVNCTPRNKLQWNSNWNSNIFIQENAFENGVCKMASISSRPQCFKYTTLLGMYLSNLCSNLWKNGCVLLREYLVTILETTLYTCIFFSNICFYLLFKFQLKLSLGVQYWQLVSIGSGNGLSLYRHQAITYTYDDISMHHQGAFQKQVRAYKSRSSYERISLKCYSKYLTYTLKDAIFIQCWIFKKSQS